MPATLTDTYLRDAMRARLDEAEATFDFMIQFQVDSRRTPIEDATVEWKEKDSPYHRVAQIRIPRQRFEDAGRMTRCEQVAFNPWHCLAEHRPLGSMNRARREIYQAMADFGGATAESLRSGKVEMKWKSKLKVQPAASWQPAAADSTS